MLNTTFPWQIQVFLGSGGASTSKTYYFGHIPHEMHEIEKKNLVWFHLIAFHCTGKLGPKFMLPGNEIWLSLMSALYIYSLKYSQVFETWSLEPNLVGDWGGGTSVPAPFCEPKMVYISGKKFQNYMLPLPPSQRVEFLLWKTLDPPLPTLKLLQIFLGSRFSEPNPLFYSPYPDSFL